MTTRQNRSRSPDPRNITHKGPPRTPPHSLDLNYPPTRLLHGYHPCHRPCMLHLPLLHLLSIRFFTLNSHHRIRLQRPPPLPTTTTTTLSRPRKPRTSVFTVCALPHTTRTYGRATEHVTTEFFETSSFTSRTNSPPSPTQTGTRTYQPESPTSSSSPRMIWWPSSLLGRRDLPTYTTSRRPGFPPLSWAT